MAEVIVRLDDGWTVSLPISFCRRCVFLVPLCEDYDLAAAETMMHAQEYHLFPESFPKVLRELILHKVLEVHRLTTPTVATSTTYQISSLTPVVRSMVGNQNHALIHFLNYVDFIGADFLNSVLQCVADQLSGPNISERIQEFFQAKPEPNEVVLGDIRSLFLPSRPWSDSDVLDQVATVTGVDQLPVSLQRGKSLPLPTVAALRRGDSDQMVLARQQSSSAKLCAVAGDGWTSSPLNLLRENVLWELVSCYENSWIDLYRLYNAGYERFAKFISGCHDIRGKASMLESLGRSVLQDVHDKDKMFELLDNLLFSEPSSRLQDSDILSEPSNCVYLNQYLIYNMCSAKHAMPHEEISSYFVRKLASIAPGSLLASMPEECPESSAMQEVKDIVVWLKLCRQKFDRLLYVFRYLIRYDRRSEAPDLTEVCKRSMNDCLQQANLSVRLNRLKGAFSRRSLELSEQWNECEQTILPLLPMLSGSHSDVLRNLLDLRDPEEENRLPLSSSQVTEALGSELSDRKQLFLTQVASKRLTIITRDAELRELDWSTIKKCGTLKWGLLSILDGREEPLVDVSNDGWIEKTVLPVMVEALIFDKVQEFDTLITVSEPSEETAVSAWLGTFCHSDIFELILAANALEFRELLDAACLHVANMIKGKTTEEIRQTFNIENDFTPVRP